MSSPSLIEKPPDGGTAGYTGFCSSARQSRSWNPETTLRVQRTAAVTVFPASSRGPAAMLGLPALALALLSAAAPTALELTDASFEAAKKEHAHLLVLFYAPWSGGRCDTWSRQR